MKKIILIFGILITCMLTSLAVQAKSNYLRSITLEKNNSGYNVILNTDKITNVSRRVKSPNELVLEISGITSSDTVNALYKGSANVDNLVVENSSPNKLKIYISAPDIKNSSVIMQPVEGQGTIVAENFPVNKAVWSIFVLLVFALIFKTSKNIIEEESKILIKKDIKDREIEMYKKYRKSLENSQSLSLRNHKKTMIKKIDRKIDERLSMLSK